MHSPNVLHLCQISLARALVVCSWFAPCAVYTRRRSNQSDGCGLAHAHHSAPFALLHSSPPRFLDGNPSRRTRQMCCLQQSQPSWLGLSPREAVCTTRSSRKLMQSCQTQSRCLYLLQSGLLASPESVPGCLQGDAVARPSQGCQNARMHSIQSSSPRWPARLRQYHSLHDRQVKIVRRQTFACL